MVPRSQTLCRGRIGNWELGIGIQGEKGRADSPSRLICMALECVVLILVFDKLGMVVNVEGEEIELE